MATETSVHRALDGRRFALTGSLDLSQPCTSVVEVIVHGRRYEFTAGVTGLGEELARANGIERFDEELQFAGGTLLLGRRRRYEGGTQLIEDLLLVVWRGQRYCLIIHLYGESTATVLGILRTLTITETADGLVIEPRPAEGSGFAAPASVVKQVPSLGLLEMSTSDAPWAVRLPEWQGAPTRSGELFADTLSNGDPYFVVAGKGTWVTVLPLADTVIDQVPTRLDELDLQIVG